MKSCSVHTIKFYKPKTKAIYCMSIHKDKKRLALSRSDGSVEIWNVSQSPFIERSIVSTTENISVEGIAWFEDRLFSVGLHGFLVEYDLKKLSILRRLIVTGEAAFCLDIKDATKQIAIGTEQGYLNIFDISGDDVLFNKFLDKQEGRILCVKFNHSGEFIVTGGLDAIRIWEVSTGHALHKLTTGRATANQPTIVWCIAVTQNFTIMSGDSRGKLSFWDGNVGAQIDRYQSHKADILSMCLSEDESSLYCSGTDSNITTFVKVQMKGGNEKWVRSVNRKVHEHDVRSLIVNGDSVFSGGADGYLGLSMTNSKAQYQYPPILQNQFVTIAKEARLVLLRYTRHIEIWSLGEAADTKGSQTMLPLSKKPKRIMVLQRTVRNQNGEEEQEAIIFATISNDGKWIAYGTRLGLRVFQFINDNDSPKLLRVATLDNNESVHFGGLFTKNNRQLITVLGEGGLGIHDVSENCLSLTEKLECKGITDVITLITLSERGDILVAADASSNIVIWKKEKMSWCFHYNLLANTGLMTAIAIHPNSSKMIIAYANNKLIELDLKNRVRTSLWNNLQPSLPADWSTKLYCIKNLLYYPAAEQILFHNDNTLMAVDQNLTERKLEEKKKKLENGTVAAHKFRVIRKYKHLVHIGPLAEGEIVAVEVNPLVILQQLPPVLLRNKFGTK